MTVEPARVERLMKRCQVGCGGSQALSVAHEIMAECYGTLGALLHENEEMRAWIAEVNVDYDRQRAKAARQAQQLDLITRLRERGLDVAAREAVTLEDEAADALEQLQARVAGLERDLEQGAAHEP